MIDFLYCQIYKMALISVIHLYREKENIYVYTM